MAGPKAARRLAQFHGFKSVHDQRGWDARWEVQSCLNGRPVGFLFNAPPDLCDYFRYTPAQHPPAFHGAPALAKPLRPEGEPPSRANDDPILRGME